jgi:hypothetical protein
MQPLLLLLLLLQVIDQSDELAALGLPVGFGRQQVGSGSGSSKHNSSSRSNLSHAAVPALAETAHL